ncbi:hypothetical protein [Streptomyces blattellae]|uniref:hypothetical protein n=1 Tax=Streptomyces blattellae TaxID=2569855 RepID=UPI0012B7EBD3|nr:hypothetical protein [Streptomyces blattellae]
MDPSIHDPLAPDPMAPVDAMELAAWRIAQTARQLRREHRDLPLQEMRPVGLATDKPHLEIHAGSIDAVEQWAKRLGAEPQREIHVYAPDTISEHADAGTDVGEVHVIVYGSRFFTAVECEAYHREQAAKEAVSRA